MTFFKRFLASISALSLLLSTMPMASAQADAAELLFEIDCNTLEKKVKVGFVSDKADPENGPEIIAFNVTLNLEATGSTTQQELENALMEQNTAYTNMIVAQNTSKVVNGKQELNVAGGFTAQNGVSNADDLFFITGLEGKSYTITVTAGELFAKNGTEDIYDEAQNQSKTIDPSVCGGNEPAPEETPAQEDNKETIIIDDFAFVGGDITVEPGTTVEWTNNDDTVHTVTSDGDAGPLDSGDISPGESFSFTFNSAGVFSYHCNHHPTMIGTITVAAGGEEPTEEEAAASGVTTISFGELADAQPDSQVAVVATITNRGSASVDWSQTGGTPIQPEIANEDSSETVTTSTLTFTMPPAGDVTLRLTVGTASETVLVNNASGGAAAPAGEIRGSAPGEGEAVAPSGDEQLSLQERLQRRREEQQAAANAAAQNVPVVPSGTIHGAAGVGLAQSGPGDTGLLVFLSLAFLYGWKKLRKTRASEL